MADEFELRDWLGQYFKKIGSAEKQQLLDAFEILASQTNLPLEYHQLSLVAIMDVAVYLEN